ncbi:geranylgeranyl reductase family protein [Pseudodesulfovibrio sp. JC047]|uniref:geranylgeranyl reductase family protein n=1 Tax=Pseudodesulfovibrio sp. JC047 TaxID=2683199 RepID=UPI0013D191AB|nr:geranylgeranyl reductase family protein [Pseudodesulfovibrio sp. JC047]NDV20659.1 geranylgeranyl reductase family protein [Pseudodesulfovibrio sp. JC047]
MTHTFDALICGGSLAGSAAGFALAKAGHSVAILDRATFPRPKLCGGLLTWKSVKLLEHLFGETPGTLTRAGAINYASNQYSIHTRTNAVAHGTLSFPFHFVDRTAFDALLLNKARQAGATIFQDTAVAHCDPARGIVTSQTGETFQGTAVIGADGANSVVRKSFSDVDTKRMRRLMAPTIEVRLPAHAFPRPVTHPELSIGFLDAGYGWVFPNNQSVIVGVCGLKTKNTNISQVFKEYLEFLKIDSEAIPDRRGHPLPYGNYLKEPVSGVTMLAGDAAGLVEPLFGEGIFFALCSGMYAGEAVAHGLAKQTSPGPEYIRRLNQQIIPELKASDHLRWAMSKGMQWIGPWSLKLFLTMAGTPLGEMVHGMRSYSWLREKHWDF